MCTPEHVDTMLNCIEIKMSLEIVGLESNVLILESGQNLCTNVDWFNRCVQCKHSISVTCNSVSEIAARKKISKKKRKRNKRRGVDGT